MEGVEVDCLRCLMRLMPSVSRFSHSNVQEGDGSLSEDDPRMGIPQLASSESSGKSLLTHLRPPQKTERWGVPIPDACTAPLMNMTFG